MSRIGIVLLAAGRGTRFGESPKILATLDGVPLVRRVAEAALAARPRPVVAVLGANDAAVRQALAGLDLIVVHNDVYADGLSTSLKAGIAALPECDAAIVMLGDMPLVDAALIDRIADVFEQAATKPAAIVPIHGGRRGNPVLLNLRLLGAEIASLSGDRGAGPLLAGRSDVIEIDGDPSTALDIDTRDALARAEDHFARLASLRQRSEQ